MKGKGTRDGLGTRPEIDRTEKDSGWYIYPQFLANENLKNVGKNAQKSYTENFKPSLDKVFTVQGLILW